MLLQAGGEGALAGVRARELAQAPLAAAPSSSAWAPVVPVGGAADRFGSPIGKRKLQAGSGLRGPGTWFWGVGSAEGCAAAIAWPA